MSAGEELKNGAGKAPDECTGKSPEKRSEEEPRTLYTPWGTPIVIPAAPEVLPPPPLVSRRFVLSEAASHSTVLWIHLRALASALALESFVTPFSGAPQKASPPPRPRSPPPALPFAPHGLRYLSPLPPRPLRPLRGRRLPWVDRLLARVKRWVWREIESAARRALRSPPAKVVLWGAAATRLGIAAGGLWLALVILDRAVQWAEA